MRDINLFPRKSFVEQYRMVLLVAIVAFGLLLVFVQFIVATGYRDDRTEAEAQLRRTETEIMALASRKTMDNRTSMIARLNAEIDKLKLDRNDWLTDMTYILGYLPEHAAVTRMNVGADAGMLDTELRFATERDAIYYMARMQAEPRFRKLKVSEFKKEEEESAADSVAQAETETEYNLPDEAYDVGAYEVPSYDESTYTEPTQSPAAELAPGEQAVRELLLSNPDDLSEKLKQLLESGQGGRNSRGEGIDDSSVLLGEDSPFSRDEVLDGLSRVESDRAAITPAPVINAPSVVRQPTEPTPSGEPADEPPEEKTATPYVLTLTIPLSVKAVNR